LLLFRKYSTVFDSKKESPVADVANHGRLMRPIDLAPKAAHMNVREIGRWIELVLPLNAGAGEGFDHLVRNISGHDLRHKSDAWVQRDNVRSSRSSGLRHCDGSMVSIFLKLLLDGPRQFQAGIFPNRPL